MASFQDYLGQVGRPDLAWLDNLPQVSQPQGPVPVPLTELDGSDKQMADEMQKGKKIAEARTAMLEAKRNKLDAQKKEIQAEQKIAETQAGVTPQDVDLQLGMQQTPLQQIANLFAQKAAAGGQGDQTLAALKTLHETWAGKDIYQDETPTDELGNLYKAGQLQQLAGQEQRQLAELAQKQEELKRIQELGLDPLSEKLHKRKREEMKDQLAREGKLDMALTRQEDKSEKFWEKMDSDLQEEAAMVQQINFALDRGTVNALTAIKGPVARLISTEKGRLTNEDIERAIPGTAAEKIGTIKTWFLSDPSTPIPKSVVSEVKQLMNNATSVAAQKYISRADARKQRGEAAKGAKRRLWVDDGFGTAAHADFVDNVKKAFQRKGHPTTGDSGTTMAKPSEVDQADWEAASPEVKQLLINKFTKNGKQ